ncbi:MAG: N-acetylneuraminate synthase [Longimicrobiales bacterium]|nr:N-acetylneuraminate synthase [Longimicrobiales bacterium]
MSTLVIAEAGVNHNGDLGMARNLVKVAAEAGADLVKFQTYKSRNVVTRNAKKADYQTRTTDADESQFEMISKLELSTADHHVLMECCEEHGIQFFSSGFDLESIDFLLDLGLDCMKIPSGEITNFPYLEHISKRAKSVILSTGMSELEEIGTALSVLQDGGMELEQITVLHCNTEYPTPMIDVNLRAMESIRQAFGVKVGYSDHSIGIEVPIAAVAMGAHVIEKHFTLDRNLSGPDHRASLEPQELKAMVKAIRNVEIAIGNGIKSVTESEKKNRKIARKSLVAACAIAKGDIFDQRNLAVKRPGTGISPMRWNEIMGSIAPRDFVPDELIEE